MDGNPALESSRFGLVTPRNTGADQHFAANSVPGLSDVVPDYNVAPATLQPVIRDRPNGSVRELVLMRWGLVPSSARRSIDFPGLTTCNVRAETISTQPKITAERKYMRNALKSLLVSALLLAPGLTVAVAQDSSAFDDLNLQIHGYATQAVVYSNHNNWNTTNSTDGSAAWTEAVVNLTVRPEPRLRVGVQARYFLLGDYGDRIILDWASAEYKFNEHLGFRVGKVKTPTSLFNEIEDIDPAYLWILLPQSVYPLASRQGNLAHYGAMVFGSIPLGERFGKIEYRGYGGERVIPAKDGYFTGLQAAGVDVFSGLKGRTFGATLHWRTPIAGLTVGISDDSEKPAGAITYGPLTGTLVLKPYYLPYYFAHYERGRLMVASEYSRTSLSGLLAVPKISAPTRQDARFFYAMTSYKLASKLTGGVYYSSSLDQQAAFNSARYQKDWTVAARYDFDDFLYLKAEQHFIDGTEIGFSTSNNPGGLSETFRMSLLKLGVSF